MLPPLISRLPCLGAGNVHMQTKGLFDLVGLGDSLFHMLDVRKSDVSNSSTLKIAKRQKPLTVWAYRDTALVYWNRNIERTCAFQLNREYFQRIAERSFKNRRKQ
ncbi:hypothetical protein AVEN_65908-1 [Araneus ventricosus]|uniref:Uncharacterized protein n=1 Tax=Araneus ventricosus TaxID=182803 RepID=A0A4Y2QDF2_ARAVE|nr:hypothetical protein AVEN_65908-1 [Araneus ventricosus]